MAIREVAALKWEDFKQIEGTGDYQFTITKFVDAKGKINFHSERENWTNLTSKNRFLKSGEG